MYKCVLIVPWVHDKWLKMEHTNRESLGTQYLVSALERNSVSCTYINAHALRISDEEILNIVSQSKYEFVGISCQSQRAYPTVKKLVKLLRTNGFTGHITIGGFYVGLAYKNIAYDLPEADTLLAGEGEYTFPALVKAISDGKTINNIPGITYVRKNGELFFIPPKRIINLDDLSFPMRDMNLISTDEEIGAHFRMLGGRGCFGQCNFCSVIEFYQPHHKIYRSAKHVVDEIQYLVEKYDIHNFRFDDDLFYDLSKNGKQWVKDFCHEIKERRLKIKFDIEMRSDCIRTEEISILKEAGLYKVILGAESGSNRILREMNKGIIVADSLNAIKILKEFDIEVMLTFITLLPTMTYEELKENYEFLFSTGVYSEYNLYNRLNIYTGCKYESMLRERGLLIESDTFYERHGYRFADKRVEMFYETLVRIRENFRDINIKLLNFRERASKVEYDRCSNYVATYRRTLWTEIIIKMMGIFDSYNDIEFDFNFENLIKNTKIQIENINRYIERLSV